MLAGFDLDVDDVERLGISGDHVDQGLALICFGSDVTALRQLGLAVELARISNAVVPVHISSITPVAASADSLR